MLSWVQWFVTVKILLITTYMQFLKETKKAKLPHYLPLLGIEYIITTTIICIYIVFKKFKSSMIYQVMRNKKTNDEFIRIDRL